MGRTQRISPPRIVGVAAFVALLVAMVLSTRFVTPEELASLGPEEFDPRATAQQLHEDARTTVPQQAAPLPEVLTALQRDVDRAADDLEAMRPSDSTYVFAVSGTGTVVSAQAEALELKVPGVPSQTQVSLATGPALNGTLLRDSLGFTFADAPNQTAYQRVGDNLETLMAQQVRSGLGEETSRGTDVRFVGLVSVTDTGTPVSPRKPVSIQPVTVEVAK